MKDFVNVGLLGAGTVGGGVLKVLEKNAEKIAKEVGKPVRITKVLDRHVDRLKQEYGDKYIFTDNADEVLEDKDIDIIVELLGREHPAKEFIARAFANGKHVVTANKDVLAKFGSGRISAAKVPSVATISTSSYMALNAAETCVT